MKTPAGKWTPDEIFENLAGRKDEGVITEDSLRAAYRNNGTRITDRLARADELFDEITRRPGVGAPGDSNARRAAPGGRSSAGPAGPSAPTGVPPLADGDYRGYAELARRIWAQHFNHSLAEQYVTAAKKNPLYSSDEEYRGLVDKLAARVREAKIDRLSDATAGLLGGAADPDYLARHPGTPAAIREVEGLRAKALGEFGWASWENDVRVLQAEIATRRYQAEIPRVYRYTAGILLGGAKAAGGTVEAVASFDKIPGGVWSLATDEKTQIAAVKALVAKLSDPSADNRGELTVEIPLAVSGTAGVVRGTAKLGAFAGKLVVKAPRKTVELWRAAMKGGGDVALDVKPARKVRLREEEIQRLKTAGDSDNSWPETVPDKVRNLADESMRKIGLDPEAPPGFAEGIAFTTEPGEPPPLSDHELLAIARTKRLEMTRMEIELTNGDVVHVYTFGLGHDGVAMTKEAISRQYPTARKYKIMHTQPGDASLSTEDLITAMSGPTEVGAMAAHKTLPNGITYYRVTPDKAAKILYSRLKMSKSDSPYYIRRADLPDDILDAIDKQFGR